MEPLTTALILAGVLVTASAAFAYARMKNASIAQIEYARRCPLKSCEQTLYWRLAKMLPNHVVLVQFPMSRCVSIKGANAASLARESLDFVICSRSMRIIAVIEIEDESRGLSDHRLKIEWLKEEALAGAGIRLIKCSPTGLLSEGYIAMELNSDAESLLAA
jgi:hypothetical protein